MFPAAILKLCIIHQLLSSVRGYHFENCELAQILLQKHKLPANQLNDCKFNFLIQNFNNLVSLEPSDVGGTLVSMSPTF